MPQARYTSPVRMCQSAKSAGCKTSCRKRDKLPTPLELTVVSSFILDTSQYHAKPKIRSCNNPFLQPCGCVVQQTQTLLTFDILPCCTYYIHCPPGEAPLCSIDLYVHICIESSTLSATKLAPRINIVFPKD